jgi:stage V sporulation protein SpoVS
VIVTFDRRIGFAAIAVAVTIASQFPQPVLAAYCGASADTGAVQSLALARGPADPSRIMDVIVVQDYARVDIQWKGRLTEYFVRDCGHWVFSGYTVPSGAPSAVASQLSSFVPRDDGGNRCLNPSYVNHPSGP